MNQVIQYAMSSLDASNELGKKMGPGPEVAEILQKKLEREQGLRANMEKALLSEQEKAKTRVAVLTESLRKKGEVLLTAATRAEKRFRELKAAKHRVKLAEKEGAKLREDLGIAQGQVVFLGSQIMSAGRVAVDAFKRSQEYLDVVSQVEAKAVETYKASSKFKEDLLEQCTPCYELGLADGHNDALSSVRGLFPDLDLSSLESAATRRTKAPTSKSMNKSFAFASASASHDIYDSLAAITGLIELCHEEAKPNSELAANLLQMNTCANDLLGILNSVLDTSKIEAGKMQPEVEEFNLAQLLEDVVDMFHPLGMKKVVDAILKPRDASILKSYLVRGDRGKLRQILSYLTNMAIMFTSERHVSVRAVARKPSTVMPLSGKRVLVVEDEPVLRMQEAASLRKVGANVDVCVNGKEAYDLVRSILIGKMKGHEEAVLYDYILMDCEMPVMNGYHATRLIRVKERIHGIHIPIIALAATSEETTKAIEAGMDFHLTKPFRIHKLLDKICV